MVPKAQPAPSWEDHAFQGDWPEAVVAYLVAHGNKPQKLWTVVNAIAAEGLADSRFELREKKRQILKSIQALRRKRTLWRYRRRWIALLVVDGDLVPLEQLKGLRIART